MDNSSSCSSIKIQFNAASPPPPMVISHFSKASVGNSKMLISAKSKDAKSNLNSTDAKLALKTKLSFL